MNICFTGHRHVNAQTAEKGLSEIAAKYPDAIWICGGAVGLDSAAALFAMTHKILLKLILPFPPAVMTAKWNAAQKKVLADTIEYASHLSVLSPVYDVRAYQRRNERMVDLADLVVAFFDGSAGGTANCVRYAKSVNRPIVMAEFRSCEPASGEARTF